MACSSNPVKPESEPRFFQHSTVLSKTQSLLREAWAGDSTAVKEIEKDAKRDLELRLSVQAKGVELVAKQLWSFICMLFLRDCAAGKTGVCANPDCPAPYFLKSRKTQKYCGDSCKQYGHRRDALKYWREKGKKKRRRKVKLHRRKKPC